MHRIYNVFLIFFLFQNPILLLNNQSFDKFFREIIIPEHPAPASQIGLLLNHLLEFLGGNEVVVLNK